jgi:hypothetical protein
VPTSLLRPTTPPEPAETVESAADDQAETQGRGAEPRPAAPARASRRRRIDKPAEKTGKRGLYLTDAVWERLQLEAVRKKTTVSAVAGETLERNLPRLRIERDG